MTSQGSTDTHRINDPKVVGIISYLMPVGWIIAFILNNPKSDLASFHLRQSLGLIVVALAIRIVMYVPLLGWLAGIIAAVATFFLWVCRPLKHRKPLKPGPCRPGVFCKHTGWPSRQPPPCTGGLQSPAIKIFSLVTPFLQNKDLQSGLFAKNILPNIKLCIFSE